MAPVIIENGIVQYRRKYNYFYYWSIHYHDKWDQM